MSVKVLSAQDATPAEVFSAEQEIKSKAYAAQARSQVLGVKVFAHCTKDQQVCLVMLSHEDSLVTLVERKPTHTQLHVSKFEPQALVALNLLSIVLSVLFQL